MMSMNHGFKGFCIWYMSLLWDIKHESKLLPILFFHHMYMYIVFCQQAKFAASLYWLVFRATEDGEFDNIPSQVTSPIQRDSEVRYMNV